MYQNVNKKTPKMAVPAYQIDMNDSQCCKVTNHLKCVLFE